MTDSAVRIGKPLILAETDMEQVQEISFLAWQIAYFTNRSPLKSTTNEDSAAIIAFDDRSGTLVVADGMGGHAAGEIASRVAVEAMAKSVHQAAKQGSKLRSGILNGFERANQAVIELAKGAGTTLSVAEVSEEGIRPYHVGDSLVLLIGNRGKLKLETTAHSPVGYGLEAGLLDDDEATQHAERHVVLNAVGTDSMRIEIGPTIKMAQRDTLLIASDGLSDNLTVPEIADCVRKGPMQSSLEELVSACQDHMVGGSNLKKSDDLTTIMLRRGI